METLSFQQLPLVVKIAIWVVFNNAWWSIEEFVIDPQGNMEVHALLPGRKWLRVGSCCCPNRRLRDLARLSPKQHSPRMSRKSNRGVSARSSRFWLGT